MMAFFNLPDYPHREHLTTWDEFTRVHVRRLEDEINSARCEEDIQKFIQTHRHLLVQHLGGGHGRWVIPKLKLGSQHVTDFVIGEKDSSGFWWTLVELEHPKAKLFTKKGDPTAELSHAIRQIQDWRVWLMTNQNYAARRTEEGGLGLTDIRSDAPGLILLGRRDDVSLDTAPRRRQMIMDLSIDIHSYDWLIDQCRGRMHDESPASLREKI